MTTADHVRACLADAGFFFFEELDVDEDGRVGTAVAYERVLPTRHSIHQTR
jgi:hypothetical protein